MCCRFCDSKWRIWTIWWVTRFTFILSFNLDIPRYKFMILRLFNILSHIYLYFEQTTRLANCVPPPPPPTPWKHYLPFVCSRPDLSCGLSTYPEKSNVRTLAWPFHDCVDIKSIDLNTLSARSCKLLREENIINKFFPRHSFAGGPVTIKSWLLGTWEMIAKLQTTGVSFHGGCKTHRVCNLFKFFLSP